MAAILISEAVRTKLRASLLEEHDLLDSVRQQRLAEVPGRPGHYRCSCPVAVRRPLDPETAELRQVEVTIRKVEQGWMVEAIEGLEPALEEPSSGG